MKVHDIDMTPSSPAPHSQRLPIYTPIQDRNSDADANTNTDMNFDKDLGCIHKSLTITANAIHLFQFLIGIAGLSYAIAISFHKPDPQHAIATILELYALILIASSSMGTMGLYKHNCKRIPLRISISTAPILAVLNIILALVIIVEKSSLSRYIVEKQHALFISDGELAFLQRHINMGTIYILLFGTAALEAMRFYTLKQLKINLAQYDEEHRREMLRAHAQSSAAARRAGGMRTPLLSDQLEVDADGSMDSFPSNSRNASLQDSQVSWWEEPTEVSGNRSFDKNGGGGWMSRVFKSPMASEKVGAKTDEEASGGGSSSGFAPLDAQLESGMTPWDVPSDDDDDGGNGMDSNDDHGMDLSWAKDETEM